LDILGWSDPLKTLLQSAQSAEANGGAEAKNGAEAPPPKNVVEGGNAMSSSAISL